MFSNKIWHIVTAIIAFALVATLAPVQAAKAGGDGGHEPIVCNSGQCTVLTQSEINALKADSDFWGLYLTYGQYHFKYADTWVRPENNPVGWVAFGHTDLVPNQIFINRSSLVSIPLGLRFEFDE